MRTRARREAIDEFLCVLANRRLRARPGRFKRQRGSVGNCVLLGRPLRLPGAFGDLRSLVATDRNRGLGRLG